MIAGAQRPMLICIILHWLLWLPECAASHCDLFSNRRCTDFPDWVYSRSVTLPFVSPFWKRSGCKGCAKPTSCNQILVRKTLHRSPFASMLRMCPLKDFATRCNADSDSHSRIKPVPHESIQSWFAHVGPMIWRSFVSKIMFDITDRIETLWNTERMMRMKVYQAWSQDWSQDTRSKRHGFRWLDSRRSLTSLWSPYIAANWLLLSWSCLLCRFCVCLDTIRL